MLSLTPEHHQHIHQYHAKKSAVAEHIINLGSGMQLQNTIILVKETDGLDHKRRDGD
jgi:hypothetical protein